MVRDQVSWVDWGTYTQRWTNATNAPTCRIGAVELLEEGAEAVVGGGVATLDEVEVVEDTVVRTLDGVGVGVIGGSDGAGGPGSEEHPHATSSRNGATTPRRTPMDGHATERDASPRSQIFAVSGVSRKRNRGR